MDVHDNNYYGLSFFVGLFVSQALTSTTAFLQELYLYMLQFILIYLFLIVSSCVMFSARSSKISQHACALISIIITTFMM